MNLQASGGDLDKDLSLADVSIMTANMSLDDSVDLKEGNSFLESSFRSPSPQPSSTPSHSLTRSPSPPIPEGKRSPVPEDRKRPTDLDILAFETVAEQLIGTLDTSKKLQVAVVMSPLGYQHVFSRPWVSKRSLSSIVERPERLKACCLGIGMAKTEVPLKLMKSKGRSSLYSPHFQVVHGEDWATQLYALCNNSSVKLAKGELEVPETWPYFDIYLAPRTIEALEGNVSAIEQAVDEIYTGSVPRAFVTVRPPGHHCHEEEASGFCIISNAHVAIQYAKTKYNATHAVILDFDLHHGDGSQSLLWKLGFKPDGPAEIPMGYFSIHDINSFPCESGFAQPEKLSNASVCFVAHHAAIWNVHFKPYETEEEFNAIYDKEYSVLFKKAAEFLDLCHAHTKRKNQAFRPLVVISAGFDGSEFESPGMQRHQVHVPTSFYNRFTRDSVALADHYGEGHLLSLLEGGYSSPAIATGVFSHLTGLAGAPYRSEWCPKETTPHEIDFGMRQRWKPHNEKWTAKGIQIGRTLFPPS